MYDALPTRNTFYAVFFMIGSMKGIIHAYFFSEMLKEKIFSNRLHISNQYYF